MKAPRIGVTACHSPPDPQRPLFKGKRLLTLEESMPRWIMSGGGFPMLVPTPTAVFPVERLVETIDGLILQGGRDLGPGHYGETALKPEWAGDNDADRYELDLIRACLKTGKPVLGVCRGIQTLNVVLGGALYQDLPTQRPDAGTHRDWDVYENNLHEIELKPGSYLRELYPGIQRARINSVHHQAVKDLAAKLVVEAVSVPAGLIEAVRYTGVSYAYAVQWHPEWQDRADHSLLDPMPLLEDFLREVDKARKD